MEDIRGPELTDLIKRSSLGMPAIQSLQQFADDEAVGKILHNAGYQPPERTHIAGTTLALPAGMRARRPRILGNRFSLPNLKEQGVGGLARKVAVSPITRLTAAAGSAILVSLWIILPEIGEGLSTIVGILLGVWFATLYHIVEVFMTLRAEPSSSSDRVSTWIRYLADRVANLIILIAIVFILLRSAEYVLPLLEPVALVALLLRRREQQASPDAQAPPEHKDGQSRAS